MDWNLVWLTLGDDALLLLRRLLFCFCPLGGLLLVQRVAPLVRLCKYLPFLPDVVLRNSLHVQTACA